MKIALSNYPISSFPDFMAWQAHTQTWVANAIQQGGQVLVFPEYGSMELVSWAPETVQQDVVAQIQWIQGYYADFQHHWSALAQLYGCVILAPSFPVILPQRVVNRVHAFGPEGTSSFQDKLHMTRFEQEIWGVSAGDDVLRVMETPWGKLGIQICYDIEFPIGSAFLAQAGAQAILSPSCTETLRGASRVHIGAQARALENQVWVGVSQTTGEASWSEAVDINYGYAAVYCPPDKNLPDTGIVRTGSALDVGWLIETLDFCRTEQVQQDGQVFNARDSQAFLGPWADLRRVEHTRLF